MSNIRLGTSEFTAAGWPGTFYPVGMKPADYLSYYATRFDTVEVDSTFYRSPPLTTVQGWYSKTPPGFVFAAKVPQKITHEKMLVDCDAEMTELLKVMDALYFYLLVSVQLVLICLSACHACVLTKHSPAQY
jgi:uncharacterized protein YecE (DUF72 family)